MVSEPASSVLRAAAKSLRGISSARESTPPLMVRPPPPVALLKARPMRVSESMSTKTSLPISTRRLARSMARMAMRVWLLMSLSFELAISSACGTVRRISVTSSGRSSTSRMISFISGWLRTTASAMCCRSVVLPVRGGATMRPRWPLPIGVMISMIRVV